MKHKKVELTELFYDLVYVYAISQITGLIHHLHHGVVVPYAFFSFALGLIIFVNSWMVQTVYTNRFGSNSLVNICFMLAQMILLMISATAMSLVWQENFATIMLPMAAISGLLLLQYAVSYYQTDNPADKAFIKNFFVILGIRTLVLAVSVFLPYHLGLLCAAVGVVGTWILPGVLGARGHAINAKSTQLNFPHLIERLSLLVIITFGEMIIGIAPFFKGEVLSIWSVLIFMIVASLFMVYIVEIDHLIDTNRKELTGNRAIYFHYLIFFGLSFITVALSFLEQSGVNLVFATSVLYLGIGLVLLGTLLHNCYNKISHRIESPLRWQLLLIYLISLVLTVLGRNVEVIILTTFISTLLMAVLMVRHNIQKS